MRPPLFLPTIIIGNFIKMNRDGCLFYIFAWVLAAWCFPWIVIPATLISFVAFFVFGLPIIIIDLLTQKK